VSTQGLLSQQKGQPDGQPVEQPAIKQPETSQKDLGTSTMPGAGWMFYMIIDLVRLMNVSSWATLLWVAAGTCGLKNAERLASQHSSKYA
jgi:hypothetical protein